VLFDIFRRAGISVKKDAPVNFLTDPQEGRSTLRPADVLVLRAAVENVVVGVVRSLETYNGSLLPYPLSLGG
jgi:hypothetical protein